MERRAEIMLVLTGQSGFRELVYVFLATSSTTSFLPCKLWSQPVWPDVAKFRHFGNILQRLGFWLRIYLALGKIWTYFSKLCMLLGKFSSL